MTSLVALVTGGSRGMGRAICLAFGAQGHTVVAAGRDATALAETGRLVREAGGGTSTRPMTSDETPDASYVHGALIDINGGMFMA